MLRRFFPPDGVHVANVEARVRFESPFLIFFLKCGRAGILEIEIEFFQHVLADRREALIDILVFKMWTHNFQNSPIVSQPWRAAIFQILKEVFVCRPADVPDNDPGQPMQI